MDFSFSHLKDGDGWTVGIVALIVIAALIGVIGIYLGFQGSVQL